MCRSRAGLGIGKRRFFCLRQDDPDYSGLYDNGDDMDYMKPKGPESLGVCAVVSGILEPW